jgi:hypothetical protein
MPMKSAWRGVGKWSLRALLVALGLFAVYVAILLFPSPLFAHQARFGEFRVYSDEPIPEGFDAVIAEAERRVEAMEPAFRRPAPRVYLCNNRERYTFFARLTRMNPRSLAISLSVGNEMFVSTGRVREFAAANAGRLRHTRFEGNLAEVIAHEIAHFGSTDALGYRRHLSQPMWKSEGWAEYQANLAAIRADPAYDLRERIEYLLDDRNWSDPRGVARSFWESQVLVEFLGEVRGLGLVELVADDVTKSWATERMKAWHRQPDPPER